MTRSNALTWLIAAVLALPGYVPGNCCCAETAKAESSRDTAEHLTCCCSKIASQPAKPTCCSKSASKSGSTISRHCACEPGKIQSRIVRELDRVQIERSCRLAHHNEVPSSDVEFSITSSTLSQTWPSGKNVQALLSCWLL